jgi:hypothetical protein
MKGEAVTTATAGTLITAGTPTVGERPTTIRISEPKGKACHQKQ